MVRENLLSVHGRVENQIGIIILAGELKAESRYEPERVLREWLEAGVNRVIVEFSQVTHIDSAGLSILLGALHRFRRHGGDLLVAKLNPNLNALFSITCMENYFKVFDSLEDAQSHFEQNESSSPE